MTRLHEAWFEVDTGNPEDVHQVLIPELASQAEIGDRATVSLCPKGSSVRLEVEAEDSVSLRAALNTWLRLIDITLSLID